MKTELFSRGGLVGVDWMKFLCVVHDKISIRGFVARVVCVSNLGTG